MIEERKQREMEYYDKRVKKNSEGGTGDFEDFNPFFLSSYKFLKNNLQDKYKNKEILDYGCGNGIHSVWLVQSGAKLTGIDLSSNSLEVARKRIEKAGILGGQANFLAMDCEKLEFPGNSFDVVFDGGTFSSLDLKKAMSEILKVLRPEGCLIGIETLGHNSLTNFKRTLNKVFGKRTPWAVGHIIRMEDIQNISKKFNKTEIYFFHLTSWVAFPFLGLPGGKILLEFLEKMDNMLLRLNFFKKYAFKVVFIFSQPKKLYGK